MWNLEIARRLAYRRAAASGQQLTKPLVSIFREKGCEGLRAVTGVGERLAATPRTLVTTGRQAKSHLGRQEKLELWLDKVPK